MDTRNTAIIYNASNAKSIIFITKTNHQPTSILRSSHWKKCTEAPEELKAENNFWFQRGVTRNGNCNRFVIETNYVEWKPDKRTLLYLLPNRRDVTSSTLSTNTILKLFKFTLGITLYMKQFNSDIFKIIIQHTQPVTPITTIIITRPQQIRIFTFASRITYVRVLHD